MEKLKNMRLFVKTRDKTYPVYFGVNKCFKIKRILSKNKINSKKIMLIYDKKIPRKIILKFKKNIIGSEITFLGLNFTEKKKKFRYC